MNADTIKILIGVAIVALLGGGDFFWAHRLAADTDVVLLLSAAYTLGVHVAYQTPLKARQ